MSRRAFYATALVVTLLVAGGASYYASSHPDGLEYVAERTGFLDTAEDSPAAGSPMADYQTTGVENTRLSGGIAGVTGTLIVLLVAAGLFWVLRRRGAGGATAPDSPDSPASADSGEHRDSRT